MFFKKPIDYNNLSCFGYLCYSTITEPHKDKFSPKALKCIFVGYSPGEKGFKLYDINSKQFIASRDIKDNVPLPNVPLPIIPITQDVLDNQSYEISP